MNNINLYGLIGYPLSHSFSQKYFTEKFENEGYDGYLYRNFPIKDITELRNVLEKQPDLRGFNVTIPYKEQIIPYIDEMDITAAKAGAVNTALVKRKGEEIYLKGYNTDVYGFSMSLHRWFSALETELPEQALVLGSGGASKAVVCVLRDMKIATQIISRTKGKTYDQLTDADIAANKLIINTTPLGMFPNVDECPPIPYQYLTEQHCLYDLVYNPEETLFMRKGLENGANVLNGELMLKLQADRAWDIWNNAQNTHE